MLTKLPWKICYQSLVRAWIITCEICMFPLLQAVFMVVYKVLETPFPRLHGNCWEWGYSLTKWQNFLLAVTMWLLKNFIYWNYYLKIVFTGIPISLSHSKEPSRSPREFTACYKFPWRIPSLVRNQEPISLS